MANGSSTSSWKKFLFYQKIVSNFLRFLFCYRRRCLLGGDFIMEHGHFTAIHLLETVFIIMLRFRLVTAGFTLKINLVDFIKSGSTFLVFEAITLL